MSKLQRSMRSKRYSVKEIGNLRLVLDMKTSATVEMRVKDCSVNGLSAEVDSSAVDQDWVEIGSIISSAKLLFGDKEIALGRLVMRRANEAGPIWDFAFSTVDMQIPVSGELSKILEQDFDRNDSLDEREMSTEKFNLSHFVENENGNVDLFDRIKEFSYFHREWVHSPKYAYQSTRTASKGSRVNLTRPRAAGRNDYIVMGSNDYLGLGSHPEVVEAAKLALDKYGFGSTGSQMSTGLSDLHVELNAKVAKIHNKEASILFNSGYTANVGIITAICSTNDLIVADQLCHASIQDAMQMSKATSRFFKHNNVEHLEAVLQKERDNFNGCLVVTEGVFSMDGDLAYLDKIYAMARKYNARVMVDQAHCFGVVGPNGFGICEKYNLLKDVDVIMGTFSKICGGIGGFATGSQELIDWLRSFSRPQIFSVSLAPSTVAAMIKSLDLFTKDRTLLDTLHKNIKHFKAGLQTLGYNMDPNHDSSIFPVVIGQESVMGQMYQSLLDDGIWCTPVVYPVVSRKNCRFRFTITASQTTTDLDYAIICLEKAMLKANFSFENQSALGSKKVA